MKGKKIFYELLSTIFFLFIYINCDPPCSGANSYYNVNGNECVPRHLCRFYSDNNCWDDCSQTSPIKPYHNYGDKECINGCTGEYLYKNETYKICYKKEQCTFIDISTPTNYLCYHDSCPGGKYHNFDSKICVDSCTGDRPSYAIGINTCYASCKDIPSGNYIYEYNNICYTTREGITCDYYYKKIDGVLKCATATNCNDMNYKYIIGEECRDNCDGYFKLKVADGLTKCFSTLSKALEDIDVNYYNLKSKLLWEDLPYGYYINKKIKLTLSAVEIIKYEVVEECENYYYIESSSKFCTNDCKFDVNNEVNINKYFVRGNKKCESSCINFSPKKYYYDPYTLECLDTCEGRLKRFQNPINEVSSQECLMSCNSLDSPSSNGPYYNYDSNICLSSCEVNNPKSYFYHSSLEKVCYPSCSDIPGGINKFEKDNYVCETSRCNPNSYFYIKKDGVIKCTDLKECNEQKLNYLIGYQCTVRINATIIIN